MNAPEKKTFIYLTNSRGRHLEQILRFSDVRDFIHSVVVDRECGSVDVAAQNGIAVKILSSNDNQKLSDQIAQYCSESSIDFVLSSFTRLLSGSILQSLESQMFNMHPSLLPAFPGLNTFNRSLESGTLFLGSTIHVIDETVDGGPIVCQCAIQSRGNIPARHRLFLSECKMLVQFLRWLKAGRVLIENRTVKLQGGRYEESMFLPNLEDEDIALFFDTDV